MSVKLKPIPAITRLGYNLIRILGSNPGPMTLQGTNTYLIGNGEKRILCDTGESDKQEYIQNLKKVLKDEKATISDIIVTHWHQDNIGGVKDVLKALQTGNECKVWKFQRSDDDPEDVPSGISVTPLEDEQMFNVSGASMKVLHTPGHTTDHCILLMNETREIFSGDCILGEGTAVFEDLYSYMKSLEIILNQNPSVIYPGHGNVVSDPIKKIQFYIEHRKQRESQILEELKRNQDKWISAMELVKIIYSETPEGLWPAASRNVTHHLEKLKIESKVESKSSNDEHDSNCLVWRFKQ